MVEPSDNQTNAPAAQGDGDPGLQEAVTDAFRTSEPAIAKSADPVGSEHILQYFAYGHLPEHLRVMSQIFYNVAQKIMTLPRSAERTVALRKLLESKDAAVRAALTK